MVYHPFLMFLQVPSIFPSSFPHNFYMDKIFKFTPLCCARLLCFIQGQFFKIYCAQHFYFPLGDMKLIPSRLQLPGNIYKIWRSIIPNIVFALSPCYVCCPLCPSCHFLSKLPIAYCASYFCQGWGPCILILFVLFAFFVCTFHLPHPFHI